MTRWLVSLLLLLGFAAPSLAAPAISCHCFQDRSFDPQRAAAADPYFLATTQNSLLAATYGISKKEVVRAKMGGRVGEDLWLAHTLAVRTGQNAAQWQEARAASGSWAGAIAKAKVPDKTLGPSLVRVLKGKPDDRELARAVVEEVLIQRAGIAPEVLAGLKKQQATPQETILACFLSRQTGKPALGLLEAVQSKNRTWGSLLAEHNIAASEIEPRVVRMLGAR